MNLVAAVISLVFPAILGLLLLGWTCKSPPFRHAPGNVALAHMAGCGVITVLLLLSQIVTGRLLVWPVYLLAALLAAGWMRIKSRIGLHVMPGARSAAEPAAAENPIVRRALLAFVGIAVLISIAAGLKSGLGWDGWTFWQLKARAFTIDGNMGYLRDSDHCFHPDYPPMIPLLSYWVFAHARSTADIWPQLIGMVFYLDLVVVSYASIRLWLNPTHALACVALIASARVVQKYALAGYADVAAAAYMLVIAALLLRRFADKDRSAAVPLMWMLGAGCLVKNESVAWTVGALLVIILLGILRRAPAAAAMCVGAFTAGYLPWFWLQRAWNLRNVIASQPAGNIASSFIISTAADIEAHFLHYSTMVGPQYPAWGLTLALVIAGIVVGVIRRNRHVVPLALLLALQIIAYTVMLVWGIWLVPSWYSTYVNDAMHRFLLQMFPAAILLAGLGCFETRENSSPVVIV